jgi:hypothetical protein
MFLRTLNVYRAHGKAFAEGKKTLGKEKPSAKCKLKKKPEKNSKIILFFFCRRRRAITPTRGIFL